MVHETNRAERKREIERKYNVIVWGKEYGIGEAVGAIVDAYMAGGAVTFSKIAGDLSKFGLNALKAYVERGIIKPDDHIVFSNITISHWEVIWGKNPFTGKMVKLGSVQLPNSFKIYVAFGKTGPVIEGSAGRETTVGRNHGDHLESDGDNELKEGDYLKSADGKYTLIMQGDGNLVGYDETRAFWASNTAGQGEPPFRLTVQSDGNVVIYPKSGHTWNSGTPGADGSVFRLFMQTDRNIVLYGKSGPIWASSTNI